MIVTLVSTAARTGSVREGAGETWGTHARAIGRRLAGGFLKSETTRNGKRFPFSRKRIALADTWGVKNTGCEIRILRKKDFDTAFSILTTDFADVDAKADFLQTMESLGKRVFSRAEDPADAAQLE